MEILTFRCGTDKLLSLCMKLSKSYLGSKSVPWYYSRSSGFRRRVKGRCNSSSADVGDLFPYQTNLQTASQKLADEKPAVGPGNTVNDDDVLIEFKDVYKKFGSKTVLKGASFKIRRGEAVGIIGGSGTGKSTTLRIAAGLLEPDSGEVLIKGIPRQGLLSDDDTSDKLKIGLVFQSGALFDSLTVGENVGFLLYEHSSLPPARIQELVAESLGRVGLSGVENLYPSELSGGMKKRVALARAIIRDEGHDEADQVIMYDEPTAGLDPVASTVVEDLIRSLQSDVEGHRKKHLSNGVKAGGIAAYIVVTHQHSTIRRSVDRLIFLNDGQVVWEGSVEDFDRTEEPIVQQFANGYLDGPIQYV